MLINSNAQLKSFCDTLRGAAAAGAPIAFDTEFLSERRYTAQLCLVQVFAETGGAPAEGIIDPFAVNLQPLLDLIADEKVLKLVHAGGQDLQILWNSFHCRSRNIFDTQIAAAFLGYGHQAGYADLVRRVAKGPQLSKGQQFTDWAARPLSAKQMEYALADVLYLPKMYEILKSALEQRGRMTWAETEFRRAEDRAAEPTPPEELYRRFNLSGLSRRQLGILRELAATRDALARNIDKPTTFIVPDPTMLQLVKHPPTSIQELRSTRGMPGISGENARELFAAIERAGKLSEDELPKVLFSTRPDPQTDVVASLLNVVTQLRASEQEISRTYLAPRDQLNALAAWWLRNDQSEPPMLPLLEDWRREMLGEELLKLLGGELAISLDGSARNSRQTSSGEETPVVRVVAPQ
jgi:ribonuclease D